MKPCLPVLPACLTMCIGVILWGCSGAGGVKSLPREPKGAVALVSVAEPVSEEAGDSVSESVIEPSQPMSAESPATCRFDASWPAAVPASADAARLHLLGQDGIREKRSQDAVLLLQKASSLAPDNALIKADYATALLQCGLIQQGVGTLEASAMLAPENADIAANLAQAYQLAGRFRAARIMYEKAAALAPEDSAIHNNLAVVLVALGDVDAAEVAIRRAISLNAEETAYLVDLGYILMRQERLQDAKIILERAVAKDSESADAFNMLGFVFYQLHHRERAMENFEKALQLNPRHRAARENLDALKSEFQPDVE